ncbi:MAG: helix-turn-helix transcriptional regulator [Rhodomicrobium sp.]
MTEAFEYLIDLIYAAAEDPREWERVLAALTNTLSATGAAIHAAPASENGFSFGLAYGADPESLTSYAEYYNSVNPLTAPLSRVPIGVAVADHQLVPRSDLVRTEFYNDYGLRFRLGGAVMLQLTPDSQLSVVGRGSDVFSDGQVALVQRLKPHLLRALSLNARLAALQAGLDTFQSALDRLEVAVILLNEKGAICYSNEPAIELMSKRDGLTANRDLLCATDSDAQSRLSELVRAAVATKGARGGSVCLPRQHAARPLVARVMPFSQKSDFWLTPTRVHAIVFVSNPDAATGDAVNEVMQSYGLTPAEMRLLSELLAGRSLQEAAGNLRLARTTSRNTLARIMAKTETHRQSELLRLILRSTLPGK